MSYESIPCFEDAKYLNSSSNKFNGSYDGKMDYTLKGSTGMEYETSK